MNNIIKVGFLVSCDFKYLYRSIPLVYEAADAVYLAIDENNRTWSGDDFVVPKEFFEWLKTFDIDNKIVIYKDDFYDPHLSPMENDTRERNMLGEFMGEGGWHIQIDADEYFINFAGFKEFLLKEIKNYLIDRTFTVCVYVQVLTIYKELEDGFLVIDSDEYLPVATRYPKYEQARRTGEDKLFVSYKMVHQSWGREETDLLKKLKSWSHKDDFNVDSYFRLWQACDKYNFVYYNNFHPLIPTIWSKLKYLPSHTIDHLVCDTSNDQEGIHVKYSPTEKALEKGKSRKVKWLNKLGILKKLT
jgi:hypothetical protein